MTTSLFLLAAIFVVTATEAGRVPVPGWMQRRMISCDNPSHSVMQCLEPLQQFENLAHDLHLAEVETSDALDYVCDQMHTAKDCVVDVHEACGQENKYAQVMRETVEGVVNHLCSDEGKDVLLTETACWENDDVEDVFEDCVENVDDSGDDVCKMITDVRTCARNEVKELCNERAANFVDELLYYFIEPMASELMDCDIQLRVSRSIMKMLSLIHKKK